MEQHLSSSQIDVWTPAFAGVTTFNRSSLTVIPANAGIQTSYVVSTMSPLMIQAMRQ